MKKKTWGVVLPIVGSLYREVEASSEEEAIEKAMGAEWVEDQVDTLETVRVIGEGNVCHAPVNEASAEEVTGDDDG